MTKIFFPIEFLDRRNRAEIFPLLRPFLKSKPYTNQQRILEYGVSEKDFSFVKDSINSDIIVLPMSWNYYRIHNMIKEVEEFVKVNSKRKILSFTSGDFGVDIANHNNLFVLRQNGNKSKLSDNHIGMPVFIDDPLKTRSFEITNLDFYKSPKVGFCGQANYSKVNAIKEISRVLFRNLLFYLKMSTNLPQQRISSSYLRGTILNYIKSSKKIKDNFIERTKYRAGAKTDQDRQRTTDEFYKNINESQYIVCVRGGGNFSVRIYETLAMGRIPLFINTDCILPFGEVEWKKHVVWIESDEMDKLEEILTTFHKQFSKDNINSFFKDNRSFWEERLTMSGYFNTLFKEIT